MRQHNALLIALLIVAIRLPGADAIVLYDTSNMFKIM